MRRACFEISVRSGALIGCTLPFPARPAAMQGTDTSQDFGKTSWHFSSSLLSEEDMQFCLNIKPARSKQDDGQSRS